MASASPPGHGRVLGLDPGERWVGVAVSDDDRRLALPLTTIDRRAEPDDGVALLERLLGPEGATLVVVGVPLRPSGEEDAQATAFRMFGEKMAQALSLPCDVQNERFSNPIATPQPAGKRRRSRPSEAEHRRRREREHAQAATNILQHWLDGQARR